MKIKIDLIKLDQEESASQNIRASALNDEKMTEAEKLARDILAPLAVAELFKREANAEIITAQRLGKLFLDCGAVCSGALWFCGDSEECQALTLADGFRVRAFGRCHPGACFVLILENSEEIERAYLVRPNW